MNYIMESNIEGINKIQNQNDSIILLLKDIDTVPIRLECVNKDCYKLLKEE